MEVSIGNFMSSPSSSKADAHILGSSAEMAWLRAKTYDFSAMKSRFLSTKNVWFWHVLTSEIHQCSWEKWWWTIVHCGYCGFFWDILWYLIPDIMKLMKYIAVANNMIAMVSENDGCRTSSRMISICGESDQILGHPISDKRTGFHRLTWWHRFSTPMSIHQKIEFVQDPIIR